MTKVALGRYAAVLGRLRHAKDNFVFGADSMWVPDCDVFGVAFSYHHYHLYPISERDVQAAFGVVRAILSGRDPSKPIDVHCLEAVLLAIHNSFVHLDIHAHIAGIEFEPTGLPDMPEPANDPESEPFVHIALLRLHEQRLSIASVGNFPVYVVRSTGHELIFGWDWFSGIYAAGERHFGGARIAASGDIPNINLWEGEIERGDLIVAATPTLPRVIALAKLQDLVSTASCNPRAVDHHLLTTLRSAMSESPTDSPIDHWEAAWVIACVQGNGKTPTF
jgi:hypothetical protein